MTEPRIIPSQFYGSPEVALAPLSSNTETTICQEICDNSVITIIPPHPTYTNSAGKEVVQMNAVLIGGNGLNG
jgi:hypothetical protein